MISQRAKDGFDFLLKSAIKASLRASPDAPCDVQVLADIGQIKENRMVILTVSSYLFRVMTLLYFAPDKPTREHFAAINKVDAAEMDEQAFLDVIGECGNICCGTLNRELGRYFPHIGMSTPNVLERNCIEYLKVLDAGYTKHFKVDLGGLTMHMSLCVCDYADIDFAVDMTQAEESTGELEMF